MEASRELSHQEETQGFRTPGHLRDLPRLLCPSLLAGLVWRSSREAMPTLGDQRFSHQATSVTSRAYNTGPLTTNWPTETQGSLRSLQRSFSLPEASSQRVLASLGLLRLATWLYGGVAGARSCFISNPGPGKPRLEMWPESPLH